MMTVTVNEHVQTLPVLLKPSRWSSVTVLSRCLHISHVLSFTAKLTTSESDW